MNLSVDVKDFKSQVKNLREKLNKSIINGILDEDFQEQLKQITQIEEGLLTELIPYYRLQSCNVKTTSAHIKPIKELGAFNFNSFLQTTLRINDNLFITSSIDRSAQFFYINTTDVFSSNNDLNVEWSAPIKEIKEVIFFMYKLNSKEILLFGARGGCYLISNQDFDRIPDVNSQLKVKRIEMKYDFDGFGRCLEINYGLFIVENGDEKLNLCEIVKEKNEYSIVFHEDTYCTIPNWTTLEKINENYFVVATKLGELYFIKYVDNQLNIIEKMDFLNDEIREIKCLEDGNGIRNSLLVTGNMGNLKILSLYKNEKVTKIECNNLKGNLFQAQSEKGTAVVLSEDGIIYLLEENFGNWYINEEATVKDVFFTNVLRLDASKYLLMDIEGRLNILIIDRISTSKDLWESPLYK